MVYGVIYSLVFDTLTAWEKSKTNSDLLTKKIMQHVDILHANRKQVNSVITDESVVIQSYLKITSKIQEYNNMHNVLIKLISNQ